MAYTVTATASGADSFNGISMTVKVLTGAAANQNGATVASDTASPAELAITPHATGSVIYGAAFSDISATTFTAAATTTFSQNASDTTNGAARGTFRSTATTTAATPVTVGATAPTGGGGLFTALAEILAAGTLAEDASAPATVNANTAKTVSTASFTPPPGSLLVAMVSSNFNGSGPITMALTNSGTALSWTLLRADADNLVSIWIARVPAVIGTGVEAFTVLALGTVTSGGTSAPVAGTSESWTVTATAGFPVAASTGTPAFFYVADPAAPSELMLVTVAPGGTGSGQSWTVLRGADGTTPVTHASGFTVEQVVGAQSLRAMRSTAWLNVVTQFGADPTGGNDCSAAFAAAFAALPADGGVIYLPAGTYKLTSTWTLLLGNGQVTTILGDGGGATQILSYVAGDAIRMYNSSAGVANNFGSGIKGILIDGTNATGAAPVGLHIGDLANLQLDLYVGHFQSTTGSGDGAGVLFDNAYSWTEQIDGRLHISSCDNLVWFKVSTGYKSFGYSTVELTGWCDAGQYGLYVSEGAYFYNGKLKIRGNYATSATVLTSSVLDIDGTAPGTSPDSGSVSTLTACELDIKVETDGGLAHGPVTVTTDSGAVFVNNYGMMSFGWGFGGFAPAVGLNNYSFSGIVFGDNKLNPSGSGAWVNTGQGDCVALGSAVTGGTGTSAQNITGLTAWLPNGVYAFECDIYYTPTGTIGSTTAFGLTSTFTSSGAGATVSMTGVIKAAPSGTAPTWTEAVSTSFGTAMFTSPTHVTGQLGHVRILGKITVSGATQLGGGMQVQLTFTNTTSADTVNIVANSRLRVTPVSV